MHRWYEQTLPRAWELGKVSGKFRACPVYDVDARIPVGGWVFWDFDQEGIGMDGVQPDPTPVNEFRVGPDDGWQMFQDRTHVVFLDLSGSQIARHRFDTEENALAQIALKRAVISGMIREICGGA